MVAAAVDRPVNDRPGRTVKRDVERMTRSMASPRKAPEAQNGEGDVQEPGDAQRAWQLAAEARERGQWARVAKLVRLARAGGAER